MLPNLSKHYNFKDINIDLSSNILGKKLKIKNSNALHTFDDFTLQNYAVLNNLKFENLVEKSKLMLSQLNCSTAYEEVIPKKYIKENKEFLSDLFKKDINSYYLSVIKKRYFLTDLIEDAVYDHTNTVTGRMKITSGLNYLTMKKEERIHIQKDSSSNLYEIDIKSCEPALLHAVLYNETPEDVYSFFGNDIPRSKVKIAVISSIYGSSIERVKKLTGLSTQKIKEVHEHFQLKKVKKEIENQLNKKGVFYNLYGRPLYGNNSPVNYWLQSSAADYSCLAFLNMLKMNKCLKLKACIHDAVIVETKSNLDIKIVNDPLSNISLKVEHSILI